MKLATVLITTGAVVLTASPAFAADPGVAFIDDMNAKMAAAGYDLEISKMELLAAPDRNFVGQTVFASDHGNKQLGSDWVAGDPRRDGRDNITWTYDSVDTTTDMSEADQRAAITAGQEDWDNEQCADIGIQYLNFDGADLGFVQQIFTGGAEGSAPVDGVDIVHAGFLDPSFFELIGGPGGGTGILGVAFSLNFVGGTDIDNNNRGDKGLAEVYYNDGFAWNTDGTRFDLQTVALHESGHALSRAHFGNVSINPNGKVLISPNAVMNAIYAGVNRDLDAPDIAGHCSDWAAWPIK